MQIEIATKNIASFNINDIKRQYPRISTSDFEKLIEIVPKDVADNKKTEYLKLICEWFLQEVALPEIKKYIQNLINKRK